MKIVHAKASPLWICLIATREDISSVFRQRMIGQQFVTQTDLWRMQMWFCLRLVWAKLIGLCHQGTKRAEERQSKYVCNACLSCKQSLCSRGEAPQTGKTFLPKIIFTVTSICMQIISAPSMSEYSQNGWGIFMQHLHVAYKFLNYWKALRSDTVREESYLAQTHWSHICSFFLLEAQQRVQRAKQQDWYSSRSIRTGQ